MAGWLRRVKEVKKSGILCGLCCMAVTDDCMCRLRVNV